ncbi:unnamed protein product [Mucor fragilis]
MKIWKGLLMVNTSVCVFRTATPNAVDDKIDAIELRMGSASNLELIQTITTQPIPLALGKFDWVPFENLTTATSYVLLAKSSQSISYSAYFTIIGQAPGVQTNATSSAVSVATAVLSTAMPQSSSVFNASSSVINTASVSASAMPSSIMTTAASASASASTSSSIVSAKPSAHVGHLDASISGAMNLKAGLVGAVGTIGAAIAMMI